MNKSKYIVYLIVFLLYAGTGCINNTKLEFVKHEDSESKPMVVPLEELTADINNFKNTYVETKGVFYFSLEESSLYPTDGKNISSRKALWIRFKLPNDTTLIEANKGLNFFYNSRFRELLNGKVITIRGIIRPEFKGHLSQYGGTIEDISYIKED